MTNKSNQGYVLISVLVVLLTVLAAIVTVNTSYTNTIVVEADTDPTIRREIEKSAFAHLQAYTEQENCGINPVNITVDGEKDGVTYALNWVKNATGTELTGDYQTSGAQSYSWTSKQKQIELYGSNQSTSWLLDSYFSDFVEIKYEKDDHHHDHSDHDEGKVSFEKDIILRSLKLGPLLREPVSLVNAELQLTATSGANTVDELQIHAIKYPWDPTYVSYAYTGIGTYTSWPETGFDNFETLDTVATELNDIVKFDITGLLRSWIDRSRPNHGFALSSTSNTKFEWVSKPDDSNFEERPRINFSYRCACGEACVGIKQNEVVVLGSLNDIDGYGGTEEKLTKLWLHRAHEDYLVPKTPSEENFNRTVYEPAGLSAFEVVNMPSGKEVIGIHVEPANSDHPDHHYYTVMAGNPVNSSSADLPDAADAELIYLQSPGDEPTGDALEARVLSLFPTKTASSQNVTDYISDGDDYVGGFSYYDERYWFAQRTAGDNLLQDYPVELDSAAYDLHKADLSRTPLNLDPIAFNGNHVPHALHVIDQHNVLLTGEYHFVWPGFWASTFGQLKSYDGDVVLYNTITKKARIIDGEIERSNGNNIRTIGYFEEPIPPAGSTDNRYKAALPTLFE